MADGQALRPVLRSIRQPPILPRRACIADAARRAWRAGELRNRDRQPVAQRALAGVGR
jgi:hypothetical protein